MATSATNTDSVLALDFGSVNTRAFLFNVVEDQYHFVAVSVVPSTSGAPFFDVGESTHHALTKLQQITGQTLLDSETETLIIPVQPNGSGVDRLVLTVSAGKSLRLVITGLLPEVSLASAQRLAATTYGKVIESIGLTDHQPTEVHIDAVLRARPELILVAGGTEKGASRSVFKTIDLISMICRLLPEGSRPVVIYAGNQTISGKIKEALEKVTSVYVAPNVRPVIDHDDLSPAHEELAEIVGLIRERQIGGLSSLKGLSDAMLLPTAYTFSRMVRFISQVNDPHKGVLGIDIGANWTTLVASFAGSPLLNIFPYGMGSGISELMQTTRIDDIVRWLPMDIPNGVVSDYLWQKIIHPDSIPMTVETLAIEQAIARQILRVAMRQTLERWQGFGSAFEPILASGAILGQSPKPSQSLLMLLDGLQPTGISTISLDQHNMLASLGSIAAVNTVLPIQVIDSGVLLNLGTVICPVSDEREGRPILQVSLEYEDGKHTNHEVRQGTISTLALHPGQEARLHLEPLRNTLIDPRQRGGPSSFKIIGGECGAVIDARGRPLILPSDPTRRRETIQRWALSLGAGY